MKFGSVCSGIEAASVAWEPLGWKAAWFSEIEPFPCAVLKHHYPDVPNLGDMTKLPDLIRSGQVEAPDLLCGGTPCQAFSVAGLRQSLSDERGNLSLIFCEIADAIDEKRKSIIFWENVPGVLNTKDNAFGCFLGALAGEDEPLLPAGGKWTNAGCVFGPQRTVAWRVLNSEYFAVAQRRKRVFVVASARADFDPATVLFEFEGVRRDIAPSREAGQSVAPTIAGCSNGGGSNGSGRDVDSCESLQIVRPVYEMHGQDSRVRNLGDVCSTVTSKYGTGGGNVPVTFQPIMTMAHGQAGAEIATDRSPTLTCNHEAPIAFHPTQDPISSANVFHSLGANRNATAAVAVGTDCYNGNLTGDIAATMGTPGSSINASGPTVMVQQPVAFNIAPGKGDLKDDIHVTSGDTSKTLDASGSNPAMHQGGAAIVHPVAMQVRRLTPVECERLQGFPDNYTNIKDKCPDGPRYKALGNSWAVPVVRWIGERIARSLG